MASELPGAPPKLPIKLPRVGLLLGSLIGCVAVWVTLHDLLESEPFLQISFVKQMVFAIGIIAGGGIGGVFQLLKQGRTAEFPWFLRRLFGATLWVIFFFGSMYLGVWLGEKLFGPVGYLIGSIASGVLLVFVRLSWSENPSVAPPPS
jgi:hypothetical protein